MGKWVDTLGVLEEMRFRVSLCCYSSGIRPNNLNGFGNRFLGWVLGPFSGSGITLILHKNVKTFYPIVYVFSVKSPPLVTYSS